MRFLKKKKKKFHAIFKVSTERFDCLGIYSWILNACCFVFLIWHLFLLQSPDMQWSYEVRGVIPEYSPPKGRTSIPVKEPHPERRRTRNYVLDNLRLTTTAVSSPIKGAPLIGAKWSRTVCDETVKQTVNYTERFQVYENLWFCVNFEGHWMV